MGLKERFEEDLKKAVREQDVLHRSVLRLIKSEVHNEEIARQKPLDDDGVVGILSRQVRQRQESIVEFRKGKREDLVQREEAELSVLKEYLPRQLTQDELAAFVQGVITETGARGLGDKGKVMRNLMPQIRGKAQGSEVEAVVSKLLDSL